MGIYAIGDLHLSGAMEDKSMEKFGWMDHKNKIFDNWRAVVNQEDLVILAGDTSWAMDLEEADADLREIDALPGKKVLIKGNHDYWWSTLRKMKGRYASIDFIYNSVYTYKDWAICGTRGWISPNDIRFTQEDMKIYLREVNRLKNSLNQAASQGYSNIIGVIHYPPTNESFDSSGFTQLFQEYDVKQVVYGHLHGEDAFHLGLKGTHQGVTYDLVSCDYLDFKLMKIL